MSHYERPYPPRMHEPKGRGSLYHLWRNKWRKIGHVNDLDAAYARYWELEKTVVEPDRREQQAREEEARRKKAAMSQAQREQAKREKQAQREREKQAQRAQPGVPGTVASPG